MTPLLPCPIQSSSAHDSVTFPFGGSLEDGRACGSDNGWVPVYLHEVVWDIKMLELEDVLIVADDSVLDDKGGDGISWLEQT